MKYLKLAVAWVKRNVFKCGGFLAAAGYGIFLYSSSPVIYRVAVVGDMGTAGTGQKQVASIIKDVDEVAFPGDLVYETGLSGKNDKKFLTHFYNIYSHLGVPLSPALGNHDYLGDAGAWREIWKSGKYPLLNHPDLYWADKRGELCQFFLDTDPVERGNEQYAQTQGLWIEREVQAAKAAGCTMLVAYGHHPYKSSGEHGDAQGLLKEWLTRYVLKHFRIYFAGHDHDMEYLGLSQVASYEGTHLVVSGAGGKLRAFEKKPPIFGVSELGWVKFTYLGGGQADLEFIVYRNGQGVVVHTVQIR